MNLVNSEQFLLAKINDLREKMIEIGLEEGLTSPNTIKISKELDKLLNQYQQNK